MGPQGVEIFDNMTLTETQQSDPESVWDAFGTYFEPKTNYRLARFQLRDMRQEPQEPINSFLTRLRSQAQKCNFSSANETEHNLIDQIIKGVAHDGIQKKLLDEDPSKLTLNKCTTSARTYETTNAHLQSLQAVGVHNIARRIKKLPGKQPNQKGAVSHKTKHTPGNQPNSCVYCRFSEHSRDKCPAKDQSCSKCGKKGHWGKVCITSKYWRNNNGIHSVEAEKLDDHFNDLQFHTITNSDGDQAFAEIKVTLKHQNAVTLTGKVDTGSAGNILPIKTFKKLWPQHID